MTKILGFFIGLLILCSCGSSKLEPSDKTSALQKEFAETLEFKITSNWANPLVTSGLNALNNSGLIVPGSTVGRFNIMQTNNHVILDSAEVDVYLPYYGERRMGGGYGTETGITYKGPMENLAVSFNKKKNVYDITFTMAESTESYDVRIQVFENLNTRILINSSHRTTITYDGFAEELVEESEE